MSKYFENCNTLEELNLERSRLMAELNKQYRDKRDALQNSESGIKPLRFLQLSAVEIPEQPIYVAMTIDRGNVPSNVVKMQNNSVSL